MESLNFQASPPIPISSPHNYKNIKAEDDSPGSPRNSFPFSPSNNVTIKTKKNNDNNTENENKSVALDGLNNEIQSSPPLDSNLFPNLFGTSWSSSSSWADIVEEEELRERKENESESNLGEKRKSKEEGAEKKKKKKKKSESKKKQHELRKVFVGNLLFSKSNKEVVPLSEKEEDGLRRKSIEGIFSQFGSILKIIPFWLDKKDFMEVDTEKTKTTSHCFVLFASKHAAERSVKYLSDFDRRVKVCKKMGKRKPLPSFYVRLCNEAENIINENSKAQTTIPSNSTTTTTSNTETTQSTQPTQPQTQTQSLQSTEGTIAQPTETTETAQTTHSTETENTTDMVDT